MFDRVQQNSDRQILYFERIASALEALVSARQLQERRTIHLDSREENPIQPDQHDHQIEDRTGETSHTIEATSKVRVSRKSTSSSTRKRKAKVQEEHHDIEEQPQTPSADVVCLCGLPARIFRASEKARKYPGKLFYHCGNPDLASACGFRQLC